MSVIDSEYPENAYILLDKGAKVNHMSKSGFSAMWNAVEARQEKLAIDLIKKYKFDLNLQTPQLPTFTLASQYGLTKVVEEYLKNGFDVNWASKDGWSSLILASENGHYDTVKLLLENGADPNQPNDYMEYPLFWSFFCDHKEIFKLLLTHGADINK